MKRFVELLTGGLFGTRSTPQGNQPSGSSQADVIVYTRTGCHLCDDAIELVRRQGIDPTLIDIDADPQLRERFNECVPVVEIGGKIRFRGKVDPILLRRNLRALRKRSS